MTKKIIFNVVIWSLFSLAPLWARFTPPAQNNKNLEVTADKQFVLPEARQVLTFNGERKNQKNTQLPELDDQEASDCDDSHLVSPKSSLTPENNKIDYRSLMDWKETTTTDFLTHISQTQKILCLGEDKADNTLEDSFGEVKKQFKSDLTMVKSQSMSDEYFRKVLERKITFATLVRNFRHAREYLQSKLSTLKLTERQIRNIEKLLINDIFDLIGMVWSPENLHQYDQEGIEFSKRSITSLVDLIIDSGQYKKVPVQTSGMVGQNRDDLEQQVQHSVDNQIAMEKLIEEKSDLEKELANIKEEHQKLKKENSDLQDQAQVQDQEDVDQDIAQDQLTAELAQLQDQLENLQSKYDRLVEDNEQISQSKMELEEWASQKDIELDEKVHLLTDLEQTLVAEQRAHEDLRTRTEQLESDKQGLEEEHMQSVMDLEKLREDLIAQKQDYDVVCEQLKTEQGKCSVLEQEAQSCRRQIANLEDQIKIHKDQIDMLQAHNRELDHALGQARQELINLNGRVQALLLEMQALQQDKIELELLCSQANKEIESLKKRVREADVQIKSATKECSVVESRMLRLLREYEQKDLAIARLQARENELLTTVEQLQAKIDQLIEAENFAANKKTQKQLVQLDKKLKAADKKGSGYHQTLETLRNEKQAIGQKLQELRQAKIADEQTLDDLKIQRAYDNQAVKVISEELKSKKENINHSKERIFNLNQELGQFDEQRQKAIEKLETFHGAQSVVHRDLSDLDLQTQALDEVKSEMEQRLDDAKVDLDNAQVILEEHTYDQKHKRSQLLETIKKQAQEAVQA